jgi:large exoprotein involved in heme utilization and adhesion
MSRKERKNIFRILCIFLGLVFSQYCDDLPYVPDENAVIYLTAVPSSIESGQTATIMIMGEKASGYPLPGGTVVYLFASTGQIENQVSLIDGKAVATYISDSEYSGDVYITAHSGQATISPEQLIITVTEVVEPDISYLFISADPMELPQNGGKSNIKVLAVDEEMEPIAGKNIWLETTAGSLSGNGIYTTNNNGNVEVTLSTGKTATVTAKYKELSSSVTVTVEEE